MKQTNNHPLVEEFYDLEDFGKVLFETAPNAPKLSKKTKRTMLRQITATQNHFSFKLIGFSTLVTALAAFIIVFGIAQKSQPGALLHGLKVDKSPTPTMVTTEQKEKITTEIKQQQTLVEDLKKTGAPTKEVKKAEKTLSKTIETGKKLGIDTQKVIEETRKSTDESDEELKQEDEKSAEQETKESSQNSGSGSIR